MSQQKIVRLLGFSKCGGGEGNDLHLQKKSAPINLVFLISNPACSVV